MYACLCVFSPPNSLSVNKTVLLTMHQWTVRALAMMRTPLLEGDALDIQALAWKTKMVRPPPVLSQT